MSGNRGKMTTAILVLTAGLMVFGLSCAALLWMLQTQPVLSFLRYFVNGAGPAIIWALTFSSLSFSAALGLLSAYSAAERPAQWRDPTVKVVASLVGLVTCGVAVAILTIITYYLVAILLLSPYASGTGLWFLVLTSVLIPIVIPILASATLGVVATRRLSGAWWPTIIVGVLGVALLVLAYFG